MSLNDHSLVLTCPMDNGMEVTHYQTGGLIYIYDPSIQTTIASSSFQLITNEMNPFLINEQIEQPKQELVDNLSLDNIDLSDIDFTNVVLDEPLFNLPQQSEELNDLFKVIDEIETISPVLNIVDNLVEQQPLSVESSSEFSMMSFFNEATNSSNSNSGCSSSSESAPEIGPTSMNKQRRSIKSGRVDKKEANKAAAHRYRSKKSQEKDQLFLECESYAKSNQEKKQKIEALEAEINLIKKLLIDALFSRNKLNSVDNHEVTTSLPNLLALLSNQ